MNGTLNAAGRIVFTILAAVAEMERESIADRVREGMRHAARLLAADAAEGMAHSHE